MSRLRTKQRRARRRRRVGYRIAEIMRLLARPGAVEWVLRFADRWSLERARRADEPALTTTPGVTT